tara:strand:+ start:808 stop:3867 length:3060 start_codon:yes stop_codon:yes gene_type:complete
MATEEDLKNQKDLNNEKRQTADIDKDINSEQAASISLEEELLNVLRKRRGISSTILSDQQDIANVINDQVKQMKFQNSEATLAKKLSKSVSQISEKAYAITSDQLGLDKTLVDLQKDKESLEKSIISLNQQANKLNAEGGKLNNDIATSLRMQAVQAAKASQEIEKIAASSKEISNTFGVKAFGGLAEISKAIPGLSKFSGPFEEAAEASRLAAVHNKENGKSVSFISQKQSEVNQAINDQVEESKILREQGLGHTDVLAKMKDKYGEAAISAKDLANEAKNGKLPVKGISVFGAGIKKLGASMAKAFGPLALITMAIKALQQVDGEAGKVAKSMGISAASAAKVNAEMADAAAASGDLLVSSKDVIAANTALNKSFGTSVAFSGELASEFASVSERTGLSEQAMAMFGKKALIAGGSIKDQLADVAAVTMELSSQTGVMMNAKDIQEGLAEMSNAQMLTAQGNTKEMARQVFQAKMLGVSQSQLEKMGGSLLDFESSIAAEMEAELLTGKQLNLEGARAAALAGDQAKLATEIRKEVGTAKEFGAMNVIQQEAMAKAFGLSRDEMADMLVKQQKNEAVKKAGFKSMSDAQKQYDEAQKNGLLTDELKNKLAKAGVLEQMKSTTNADKMAAITEKITDLFVQLVDPLLPVVDIFTDMLGPVMGMLSPIFKMVGDLVKLIAGPLKMAFGFITSALTPILDAITSIKDLVGAIFSPTESLSEKFAEMGPLVSGMAVAFGVIGAAILGSMVPGLITSGIAAGALAIQMGIAAVASIASASALTLGIGIVAVVAGIAAAVAAMKSAKPAGDMLSPASGQTQISTKEGGLFNMSPNDDIIAAPGAIDALSSKKTAGESNGNIGDTIANAITGPMRGVMDIVGGVFGNDSFGDILKNPLEGIMDTVSGMFGSNDIEDSLISAATAPMRGIMDVASGLFGGGEVEEMSSPDMGGSFLGGIGDVVGSLFGGSGPSTETSPTQQENTNNAEMVTLLKDILVAVKEGGDVYIDGAKAGRSMALATSRIG